MKNGRLLFFMILFILILSACSNSNNSTENNDNNNLGLNEESVSYPEKDISGIIQFGEGGSTDNVIRFLAPLVEENLGKSLVLQNKTGAGGAVATEYVYNQDPDGYTLLLGAEPPLLYQVLDTSDKDYIKDFYPISLLGQGLTGIMVREDSEFDTLDELMDYAKENPGKLNFATSGSGTRSEEHTSELQSRG